LNKKLGHQQESDLPKLAAPAQRALASAGIQQLRQLSKFSEAEINRLHGIGPNAINRLRSALHAKELSFAKERKGKNIKGITHEQKSGC